MNAEAKKKLKGCPFCGGEAALKTSNAFGNKIVYIRCRTCGCSSIREMSGAAPVYGPNAGQAPSFDECVDKVIKSWNSRAITPRK